jgi:hypothetical protein
MKNVHEMLYSRTVTRQTTVALWPQCCLAVNTAVGRMASVRCQRAFTPQGPRINIVPDISVPDLVSCGFPQSAQVNVCDGSLN